ncbi:MAG: DUF268 domain-containing protein [Polyangiales bacterium]
MASPAVRYVYRIASQLMNPLRWPLVPRELAEYARDLRAYRREARAAGVDARLDLEPVFFNRAINSPFDSHYTYQSAWATRRIVERAPAEHVDVSSSVPFVAQLASVLPVTMFEFRAPDITLPNLTLREATVLDLPLDDQSVQSLSCMHVIEHVGLGRYGDPLDPRGTERALRELCRVVAPGGTLYLSLPVGRARVAFNAHRVTAPHDVVDLAAAQGLVLGGFAHVDDAGRFHDPSRPGDAAGLEYGLGCFELTRPAAE